MELPRRGLVKGVGAAGWAVILAVSSACGLGSDNMYIPSPAGITNYLPTTDTPPPPASQPTFENIPSWSRNTPALQIPPGLLYTPAGTWVETNPDNRVRIGITYHLFRILTSQSETDARITLSPAGTRIKQSERFGAIETYDAMQTYSMLVDLIAPVTGTVVEVNPALLTGDVLMGNFDMYGDGWMIVMKIGNPAELQSLLSAEEYAATYR